MEGKQNQYNFFQHYNFRPSNTLFGPEINKYIYIYIKDKTYNSYTLKEILNHKQTYDKEEKYNSHKNISSISAGNRVSP